MSQSNSVEELEYPDSVDEPMEENTEKSEKDSKVICNDDKKFSFNLICSGS